MGSSGRLAERDQGGQGEEVQGLGILMHWLTNATLAVQAVIQWPLPLAGCQFCPACLLKGAFIPCIPSFPPPRAILQDRQRQRCRRNTYTRDQNESPPSSEFVIQQLAVGQQSGLGATHITAVPTAPIMHLMRLNWKTSDRLLLRPSTYSGSNCSPASRHHVKRKDRG